MASPRTSIVHTGYWHKLRAHYASLLPLPCARCGVTITSYDAWDLGHRTDLALGGDPLDVWPEHRHPIAGQCSGNRGHGATVRVRTHAGASRQW